VASSSKVRTQIVKNIIVRNRTQFRKKKPLEVGDTSQRSPDNRKRSPRKSKNRHSPAPKSGHSHTHEGQSPHRRRRIMVRRRGSPSVVRDDLHKRTSHQRSPRSREVRSRSIRGVTAPSLRRICTLRTRHVTPTRLTADGELEEFEEFPKPPSCPSTVQPSS